LHNLRKNGNPAVEIGICLKLHQKEMVPNIAADYFEFPFADAALLSEEDFSAFQQFIRDLHVNCPVMTQLLPKTASVVASQNAAIDLYCYLQTGFDRARCLGVKTVVFGNAAARNIPKELPEETAQANLISFCKAAARQAQAYGITICIEPLNRIQSNHINTLAQATALVRAVNEENFGITLDYFHFQVEKDSFIAPEAVRHCHTASLLHRSIPDPQEQTPFLFWLKNHGYRGGISFEFDRFPDDSEKLNQAIAAYRFQMNSEAEVL